uniref:Uncharacterized protein n=1 Tax=Glossina palpalis gambiensis TaxID=67801 RepID=A0A1B0AYC4_9MUSC
MCTLLTVHTVIGNNNNNNNNNDNNTSVQAEGITLLVNMVPLRNMIQLCECALEFGILMTRQFFTQLKPRENYSKS